MAHTDEEAHALGYNNLTGCKGSRGSHTAVQARLERIKNAPRQILRDPRWARTARLRPDDEDRDPAGADWG